MLVSKKMNIYFAIELSLRKISLPYFALWPGESKWPSPASVTGSPTVLEC